LITRFPSVWEKMSENRRGFAHTVHMSDTQITNVWNSPYANFYSTLSNH